MDILPAAGKKASSTFSTAGSAGETRQSVSPVQVPKRDPSAPISFNDLEAQITPQSGISSVPVPSATLSAAPPAPPQTESTPSVTYKADRPIATLDIQLEVHGAAPLRDALKGPALKAHTAKSEFFSRMESVLSQPAVDPRQTLNQVILAMNDLHKGLSDAAASAAAGEVSAVSIPGSAFNVKDARLSIMKSKIDDLRRAASAANKERDSASFSLKALNLELARREAEIEALEAEARKRPVVDRQPLIEKAAELRALLPEVRGKVTTAKDRLSGADSMAITTGTNLDQLEKQLMNEMNFSVSPPIPAPPIPDMVGLGHLGQALAADPTPPAAPQEKTFMQKAIPFAALAGILGLGYSALSKGGSSTQSGKGPKKREPVMIDSLED